MPDPVIPDFGAHPLDPVAVRVLAALVEKEFLTPANYPLTLNALTSACNQSSAREPVMALEEVEVADAVKELARRGLVREILRSDSRVKRYRHTLSDTLHLHAHELAALCVLMLRGPQTVGEINGRTGRMAEFVDLSHVEITLQSLQAFDPPLATQLPRQPGQKEARYAHGLGPDAGGAAGAPSADPGDRTVAATAADATHAPADGSSVEGATAAPTLREEVARLRGELEVLREEFEAFREQFR